LGRNLLCYQNQSPSLYLHLVWVSILFLLCLFFLRIAASPLCRVKLSAQVRQATLIYYQENFKHYTLARAFLPQYSQISLAFTFYHTASTRLFKDRKICRHTRKTTPSQVLANKQPRFIGPSGSKSLGLLFHTLSSRHKHKQSRQAGPAGCLCNNLSSK
jgi:hypothetical protein